MSSLAGTFGFDLPPELEATAPPEARGLDRDQVRLLVTYRQKDGAVHGRFVDLPDYLQPGDLVVANNSATLPAALSARRADGSTVALHLSTPLPDGAPAASPSPGPTRDPYRSLFDAPPALRESEQWGIVDPRPAAEMAGETLAVPVGARADLRTP